MTNTELTAVDVVADADADADVSISVFIDVEAYHRADIPAIRTEIGLVRARFCASVVYV